MERPTTAVVLIGHMQSGKSTLSRELCRRHPWKPVSFGNAIRNEAANRGIPITRAHLQDLGEEYLRSIGSDAFWANVRSDVAKGDVCVVDGVRHVEVLEAIKRDCERVLTIGLVADINVRYARYASTAGLRGASLEEFEHWNSHVVEHEIDALIGSADLIIDAVRPTDAITERIEFALPHDLL